MMTVLLNTKRIRTSTPAQLCDYYNELATQASDDVITTQLLDAIYSNSNPPATFAPWLGVAKSFTVMRRSLVQRQSILVRQFAVKQLCKNLQSWKWKATWEGLGGTSGILEILTDLSVLQVRIICKALGHCARGNDMNEKRQYITDLFKGLHPRTFPDAKHQTTDKRPLANHYGHLLSACTPDLIFIALAGNLEEIWKHTKEHDLLEHHPEELGQKQILSITGQSTDAVNKEHLRVLANRYRTTIPSELGVSASMKFAMTCLRALGLTKSCKVDETFVVNDLIQPLLSRAVRKRINWIQIVEVVDLTLQYFENHPLAGKLINSTVGHVLHLIACCWARQPGLFETQLRTLFDHPEYGTSCLDELTGWGSFLSRIVPSRRYALMRFCIHVSTNLNIDLDTDLSQVKGSLSQSLLVKLDHTQALELFDRVRKVRGNYAFLECNEPDSILRLGIAHHVAIRDSEIWHIHLLKMKRDHHTALNCADKYTEVKRKSAKSASRPEQRAHYAKAALFAAIASGSLECYNHNLKWAQRFLNDPLVLEELYPQSFPRETAQILAGIPESIDSSFTVSALRSRVEKANAILVDMFGTACSAMMQPSFSSSNWRGVQDLFQQVVEQRITLTKKLSETLKASSDELYDSVWEGTVQMLIMLEERANSEVCKKLEANRLTGLLDCLWVGTELRLEVATAPTLRFFDRLAKGRDELWRKIRAATHPAMNSIPECLPRGLPIQYLTSCWILEVENLEKDAPYLSSRVRAALFMDPEFAFQIIPTDDESRKLIGVFVDSYEYALKLYIPESCTKAVKQARVKEVWDFATGPLSRGRIYSLDIIRYWKDTIPEYLTEWLPKDNFTVEPWAELQKSNGSTSLVCWDPLAFEYAEILEIESGKPRYIDVSVTVGQTSRFADISYMLSLADYAYKELGPPSRPLWNKDRKMSETEVLSALLYIDAKFADKEDRLLRAPYPSTENPRYPAICLDDNFISHDELRVLDAVKNIRGHLGNTPPDLLYRLARSVMCALDAVETTSDPLGNYSTHELQSIAMLLIVRLGESDNPSLAIQLAVDAIISRPVSSPWHRELVKIRFLRSLSAADAAECYRKLVSCVTEISQDHMDTTGTNDTGVKSSATAGDDENSAFRKGPHVKVTTIKMLVQLLQGTEIVEQNFAIDTLRSLATIATHVDVRLSIANTLLEMLGHYEAIHTETILEILESITKEAGNLNEREPLHERDWENAEASVEPPDIRSTIDEPVSISSPMLHTLVSHIRGVDSDAKYLKAYLNRIIFPLFQKSKQQTTRWLSIFLRKHGIDETAQQDLDIPTVPHRTDLILLRSLLADKDSNKIDVLPLSILKSLVAYAIFTLAPPPPIAALNKRLKSDPTLSSQPDTQIYSIFYTKSVSATQTFRSYDLIALTARLYSNTALPQPNNGGITPEFAHSQLRQLLHTILYNDLPTFPTLSSGLLPPLLPVTYLAKPWWPTHGRSLVASLIAQVSSIRTPEWLADPHRHPVVLPETLPWQLMLLDFPVPSATDRQADTKAKCQLFSRQLLTVIAAQHDHYVSGSDGGIVVFQHVRTYLALWPGAALEGDCAVLKRALARNMLLAATYLWEGNLEIGKEWGIVLRVAKVLVEEACAAEGSAGLGLMEGYVRERVQSMVEMWRWSEEEEVRRVGWELGLRVLEA